MGVHELEKEILLHSSEQAYHGNVIVLRSGHLFSGVEKHMLMSDIDGVVTARAEHLCMLMFAISAVTTI